MTLTHTLKFKNNGVVKYETFVFFHQRLCLRFFEHRQSKEFVDFEHGQTIFQSRHFWPRCGESVPRWIYVTLKVQTILRNRLLIIWYNFGKLKWFLNWKIKWIHIWIYFPQFHMIITWVIADVILSRLLRYCERKIDLCKLTNVLSDFLL